MNLRELREGEGCPFCVGREESFHWAGGDIGVSRVLAGGYKTISEEFDEYGWPKFERARCQKCKRVWDFEFYWTDRPPLLLTGKVVQDG